MKLLPSSVQMDLRQLLVLKAMVKQGVGALLLERILEIIIFLDLRMEGKRKKWRGKLEGNKKSEENKE